MSAELAEALVEGARDERAAERMARVVQLLALSPGIHNDVGPEIYHAPVVDWVSKSALDRVHQAPAIQRAWADGMLPDRPLPSFRFGTALHMAMLEPERFSRTYLLAPDFGPCRKTDECSSERAKENKTRRDAWRLEHAGAVILDSKEGAATLGMIRALLEHPLARKLLDRGVAEVTAIAKCPATGLDAKSRGDYMVERLGTLADLKSCEDASPDGFRRTIARYRYHVQDALYRAVFGEAGFSVANFVFVAVEKTYPHLVALHALDAEALNAGHVAWQADARTLARCLESNVWPGYEAKINQLSLPPWAS